MKWLCEIFDGESVCYSYDIHAHERVAPTPLEATDHAVVALPGMCSLNPPGWASV